MIRYIAIRNVGRPNQVMFQWAVIDVTEGKPVAFCIRKQTALAWASQLNQGECIQEFA